MLEIVVVLTDSLIKLSQNSSGLTQLLLTLALTVALVVIGLLVWKGL
jgi:hypothetical protein